MANSKSSTLSPRLNAVHTRKLIRLSRVLNCTSDAALRYAMDEFFGVRGAILLEREIR